MELFSDYFRKDHILSRIDARVKLFVSLSLLAMVLSYKGFAFSFFVILCSLILCVKMRIPLRVFLLRFSEAVFIASVLMVIKLFFSGRDALFTLNVLGITIAGYREGLLEGGMMACRMMGAVSIIAVLGFSTPFTELVAGLSWFRVPKGFIEILMLAYRYIFVLLEEAQVIYTAQKNRLGYSTMGRGLRSFGTLAGSLTIKAFDHSHNTTVAMVQRGYDGNMPLLKHKPFRFSEIIVSILFISILGVIWKI